MDFDTSEAIDEDGIYKALASPARREILQMLKSYDLVRTDSLSSKTMGLSVSEICALLKLGQSTVSAHLSVLSEADLVTVKAVGQWRFFRRNEVTIGKFILKVVTAI